MSMKVETTGSGFKRAEFTDYNGDACSIQESSSLNERLLWLGCDSGTHHMGECLARMHLTQDMAAMLIPLLTHFVETGELPNE